MCRGVILTFDQRRKFSAKIKFLPRSNDVNKIEIKRILEDVADVVSDLLHRGNEAKLEECLMEYSNLDGQQIAVILEKSKRWNLSSEDLIVIHTANGERIRSLKNIQDKKWFTELTITSDVFLNAECVKRISRADVFLIQDTFYYF
ncbi:hypothetical protein ACFL08_00850 [Patescibacteria group bacterium]